MRKVTIVLLIFFAVVLTFSVLILNVSGKNKNVKDLILYYSLTGNTKTVARVFEEHLNADIIRIEDETRPLVSKLYDKNIFVKMKKEPWKLKPVKVDFSNYNRVFIGGQIWYGEPSLPISTFVEQTDFTGKEVVIFLTNGYSDPKPALSELASKIEANGGKVISSFSIKTRGLTREDIEKQARIMVKQY